jgi:hypothetical protein
VARFKYLGAVVTNQNYVQEEIKEKTGVGEGLLPFGSEPYAFPFYIQRYQN